MLEKINKVWFKFRAKNLK